MKNLYKIIVVILLTAYISSCAVYTCPTYAKKVEKKETNL